MNILITGGTGFIGRALSQALIAQGHQLTILSRQPKIDTQALKFIQNFAHIKNLDAFDAVINLAGEPIFAKTWTGIQKSKLRQSRLELTQKLVELCQKSSNPPHTFLSASATGYYGNLAQFAKNCTEQTACGNGFAAQLCQEWEACALQAQNKKTRVCLLRTGIVLDTAGGALKQMLALYRLGLGGKLGHGKQHWAWISLEDHIQAMLFLLENPDAQGAFNFVAPQSIRNTDFNCLLAKAIHRPAFFSVPAFVLKLILGERSQLLLDNQPLVPHHLTQLGFKFKFNNLEQWLASCFK